MRKKQDPNLIFALSDFWKLLKNSKKTILCSMLFFSVLTLIYAAGKEVRYQSIGTFHERGVANSGMSGRSNSFISSFLGSGFGDGNDSEAVTVMKSRRLMEKLVESEGLQAQISPYDPDKGYYRVKFDNFMDNVKKHFQVEYAYLMEMSAPILPDKVPAFTAENVIYYHEVPFTLILTFVNDKKFKAYGVQTKTDLGEGYLDEPFSGKDFQVTLRSQGGPLESKQYLVTLLPLTNVAEGLTKSVEIESDKLDKSLVKLRYSHKNRLMASYVINSILVQYQDHLKLEHHRLSNEQLSYLQGRQRELNTSLRQVMEEYASTLSSELSSVGFANSQKAMEFLASNQHAYRQKQLQIDQEIKRYERNLKEGVSLYARSVTDATSPIINSLVNSIREMKSHGDNLDLNLRQHPMQNNNALEDTFKNQLAYLISIQKDRQEASDILNLVAENHLIPESYSLLTNPDYMVGHWNKKLMDHIQDWKIAPTQTKQKIREECVVCKENFEIYLKKLIHLLGVFEKTLQERITHLHLVQDDFQGIDLQLAKELFLQYTRELNLLEATIAQQDYVINHLQDPDFEISSLSTILIDSVSREMIQKASTILLALRDENNRSQREQERLREELKIQRGFILLHLNQTNELNGLKEQLLKSKVFQVQKTMLALIQQQITVLEQQLSDHIEIHINNLKQEKELLKTLQEEIQGQMAKLPTKWVEEQFVDLQLDLNQRMGKEITNLVESKNINSNLEFIRSSPMDLAYPSIHPIRPRLVLFSIVGAIIGTFVSVAFVTLRGLLKGLPASEDNLRLANQYVAGTLQQDMGDLEPLRHLLAYLDSKQLIQKSLLLLEREGLDYSKDLAELMSKKGERVIVIPLLSQQKIEESENVQGLLQYLEGTINQPKIYAEKGYWTMESGGRSQFASELLNSKRFHTLFDELLQKYDWVIGVSQAAHMSGESEVLLNQFEAIVFSVTDESVRDLSVYFELNKPTSFIFTK